MANVLGELFQNIADAIRSKTGSTDTMKPNEFPAAIEGITTGGGSSADVRYVTFRNESTGEEYKKAVAVGDDCVDVVAKGLWKTPTKESTAQYNYTFYGWGASDCGAADANILKNITEDKTVYAIFTATVRYYTITWLDSDGVTELPGQKQWAYGTVPSYTPAKDGYLFTGWTPEVVAVTVDASYTAQWQEVIGGSLTDTANWMLSDGVLRIYGTGTAGSYSSATNVPWYQHRNDIESVVVEDGITALGGTLFNNCANMKTATISNSVISFGNGLFYGCGSLESLSIPCASTTPIALDRTTYASYPFGTFFGENSFTGSVSTSSATSTSSGSVTWKTYYLPSSLTTVNITGDYRLPWYAFHGCTKITNVTISDSVPEIPYQAFRQSAIKTFTVPSGVKTIASGAFSKCSSLSSVSFAVTSGWKAGSTTVYVTDPTTNATKLTNTYVNSVWTRS